MISASELANMTTPGAIDLPVEVGPTAAVDAGITATVGAHQNPPIADRRAHEPSAVPVQSGSGCNEARQNMSSVPNFDPEKQEPGGVIDDRHGVPDIAVVEEEVGTISRRSVAVKKILTREKIGWEGPDDEENPHNWSRSRKTTLMMLISIYRTTTTMAGSFLAPALLKIAVDLDIPTQQRTNIILSAYVLAFAVGPLFLGPTSEVFGRTRVLHCANVFFLLFNIAAGFSTTAGQMIAFRFLSGIGGSAPMALGAATLGDFYDVEERGSSMGYYTALPLIGFALGPIPAGFIVEYASWRWTIHILSMLAGVTTVIGFFAMRETYAPVLLERKRNRLAKQRGSGDQSANFHQRLNKLRSKLRVTLPRPFKLMGTRPLLQVMSLYSAYIYGLEYLAITTFPAVWSDVYGERTDIASINYVSLALGFLLGSQVFTPLQDKSYKRFMAKNNGKKCPEYRAPLMLVGAVFVPVGIFWYGWSLHAKLHWIMPNIGACLFAMGIVTTLQVINPYLVEAYEEQSASAVSCVSIVRSIAGFGFPLFAPQMYATLGYGWGNSVLGFFGICVGVPAPILLWYFGAKLRMKTIWAPEGILQ